MGDVGAYWDNAVVERFFGSLKHDWILKVHQPTRGLGVVVYQPFLANCMASSI